MPQILNLTREKDLPEQPEQSGKRKIEGRIDPHHHLLDKKLLWGVSLFFSVLGIAFIFFGHNFITAVFFFLIVAVLWIMVSQKQSSIPWKIDSFTVTVGHFSYPYQDLKSFWIDYEPRGIKELSFKSKKWYHPYIKIPLPDHNPLELREFLLQFLAEEKHEDSIVEVLTRKLGL